jgi:predicted kinase
LLIILSGLPGVGKTTIARALATRIDAVHIRIDTIEQALRQSARVADVADLGYRIAYAVAEENLRVGRIVIADSVNPLPITREAWRDVAARAGVRAMDVEVICSDEREHRRRVESRDAEPFTPKLTWLDVATRDYRPWDRDRLVVDTASGDLDAHVAALQGYVRA